MKRKPHHERGKSAVQILEEAQHLLRTAPLSAITAYMIGTVPFILGLLYFWADMSRNAFAADRCGSLALGLAFLFVWMKCWQTVFASTLRRHLTGEQSAQWTAPRVGRMMLTQCLVQPIGLLVLPVAMGMAVPFYAAYAFYQNVTTLGDGLDDGTAVRSARRLAILWPAQNHLVLWMVSPWILGTGMALAFGATAMSFSLNPEIVVENSMGWLWAGFLMMYIMVFPCSPLGTLVAVNIAIGMMALPYMLRSLLGIDTVFVMSGPYALLNTTFVTTVWGLSYLVLDPVAKAAYVVRCFYGASRTTGEDLHAQLRRLGRPVAVVALLLILLVPGQAAGTVAAPSIDSETLSQTMDEVLSEPEYAWRLPRERSQILSEHRSLLSSLAWNISEALRKVFSFIGRIVDWIGDRFKRTPSTAANAQDWDAQVRALWIGALVAVLAFGSFLAYRTWRLRAPVQEASASELPGTAPDLADAGLLASALPSEEWMSLAKRLLEEGDWRGAVHAMFLASLADLGAFHWVTIAPYKSNGQYWRELRLRAVQYPELLRAFSENMTAFECTWYGTHEVTAPMLRQVEQNWEVISRDVAPA